MDVSAVYPGRPAGRGALNYDAKQTSTAIRRIVHRDDLLQSVQRRSFECPFLAGLSTHDRLVLFEHRDDRLEAR